MIWINGYTLEEQERRLSQWHKWFAWFPVSVGITKEQRIKMVWWQFVERKGECVNSWYESWWNWEYRLMEKIK